MGNISSQSHAPLQGSDKDNVQTQVYECTTKNMIKEKYIIYTVCVTETNNHLKIEYFTTEHLEDN